MCGQDQPTYTVKWRPASEPPEDGMYCHIRGMGPDLYMGVRYSEAAKAWERYTPYLVRYGVRDGITDWIPASELDLASEISDRG